MLLQWDPEARGGVFTYSQTPYLSTYGTQAYIRVKLKKHDKFFCRCSYRDLQMSTFGLVANYARVFIAVLFRGTDYVKGFFTVTNVTNNPSVD